MSAALAPQSRFVPANGLSHHVLAWDGPVERTVFLLHGYLDLARSFVRAGDALARAGYRVFAPDFRGHGESGWVPAGGYYYFPDYVADLAGIVDALAPARETPHVSLLAHSMGGSVATLYAGALPARVRALALAEGTGPPGMPADATPDRLVRWLESVAKVRGRETRRFDSLADVVARLRLTYGDAVPEAVLADVAVYATRPHADGAGLVWRFDPLHQTTSPTRFDGDAFEAFVQRITAPVLLIDGGASGWMAWPDAARRHALYAPRSRATLEGAGHMMHWTAPDALAAAAVAFFREVGA